MKKTVITWDAETTKRFWNWTYSKEHLNKQIFTYQVGRGVVRFIKKHCHLSGKVLDYGCGRGYLIEHLLKTGLDCYATDLSSEGIEFVNNHYKENPKWKGATLINGLPTSYKESNFDIVTCIETIEHLNDELLFPVCSEIYRILKPGGIAVFTTPFNENLEENMIYCPFCDTQFHPVQHQRSFNEETLTELLEKNGYKIVYCNNINFAYYNSLLEFLKISLQKLISKKSKNPHLCAIAKKPLHLT